MATWELLLPGPACLCPQGVKPRHLVINSFLIHSDHPQRKRRYLPCLKIWVCSLPDNLMRFWSIIPLVSYDAKGVQTQAHNWWNPSSNMYEASLIFPKLSTLQEAREVIFPDMEDMWYELEDAPLGQKNNKVVTPIIKKDTLSLHSPIRKRAHGLGISGPTLHPIGENSIPQGAHNQIRGTRQTQGSTWFPTVLKVCMWWGAGHSVSLPGGGWRLRRPWKIGKDRTACISWHSSFSSERKHLHSKFQRC